MMRYANNKKKKNNDNFTLYVQLVQGSYGHEKSWKVVEFENAFSRPGKVMDFRENG